MNRLSLLFTLIVAILMLLPAGCRKKAKNIAPAPPIVNAGPPITDDECREYGMKLQTAVLKSDRAEVGRLYRIGEIFERSVSTLDINPSFRAGVLKGAQGGHTNQLAEQLIDASLKGGSFTFLRVRSEDGRKRAVMRLVIPNGGLNYQEIVVARHADGNLVAEDVYVMLSGEFMSQSFRRIILQAAAESDRGLLSRLKGKERVLTQSLDRLQAMTLAVRQNRHRDAFKIYQDLPAEIRNEKFCMVIAAMCAQSVGDAEYLQVLETFRKQYPNDPASDLMSIDYFLLKKQFDPCVQCIDRLEQRIGGDPYLCALRGSVYTETGQFAKAKAEAEKAVTQEPTLQGGYWTRVTVALKERNHADTLVWLKKVVEKTNALVDEVNMRQDAIYADFVPTPQYQEFWKWYRTR